MTTLVYLVARHPVNESLRYSLRSVAEHMPDAEVVIAGFKPSWLVGVDHVPVPQRYRSPANQLRILDKVSTTDRLPEDFVLMNDDFFALKPVDEVKLVHNGALSDLRRSPVWSWRWYRRALEGTIKALTDQGYESPLSYDRLHRPMPMKRSLIAGLALTAGPPVLPRSMVGNLMGGGTYALDCKIRDEETAIEELDTDGWVSTDKHSWRGVAGQQLRDRFPAKSRFER